MENKIAERHEIKAEHKWNLEKLYPNSDAWEKDLEKLKSYKAKIESYQGQLGESVDKLKSILEFMREVEELDERLGYYAFLRTAENVGDSESNDRQSRFSAVSSAIHAAASYQNPELLAIEDSKMDEFLKDEKLAEWRIYLSKILRYKPHVLSPKEEKLIAMLAEAHEAPQNAFSALTNVDMLFGEVEVDGNKVPLSQSTLSSFLINPDRSIREKAYKQFYKEFEDHKNTLANLYNGSVQQDIYHAKVKNHDSARAASLFQDNVPEAVYDNLISTVHNNLPVLHRYYSLRKKLLGVDKLKHYDVYVPIVKDVEVEHTYEDAVELIYTALAPLGDEYRNTIKSGLLGNWVDRYENKGKRSGAFSAGSFHGEPYILMNYKKHVIRDLFTLAHEGGHSMHSYYSIKSNPFQHYNYSIFEAEVASTFNEEILADYMLKHSDDQKLKAYLIGMRMDDMVATLFRQTMFAEFEHLAHKEVESGGALTLDKIRSIYKGLLTLYFGPDMEFEENSDLEALRIPHFYRAFYVYKYATGISAAVSLSRKVLNGTDKDTEQYLNFLKSGGSKFPLDSLKAAGVDMSKPEPIAQALDVFKNYLDEFEKLI